MLGTAHSGEGDLMEFEHHFLAIDVDLEHLIEFTVNSERLEGTLEQFLL